MTDIINHNFQPRMGERRTEAWAIDPADDQRHTGFDRRKNSSVTFDEDTVSLAVDLTAYEQEFSHRPVSETIQKDQSSENSSQEIPSTEGVRKQSNWWKRHKAKVYLGAVVAGVAGTVASAVDGSFDNVVHEVMSEAEWTVPALIGSEALFVAGIAGMSVGAGRAIGNPLKLRGKLHETLAATSESSAYKMGLAANTIGALGTAGIVAGGVIEALPPETWPGALSLVAMDVASTITLRAGAYNGIKAVSEKHEAKKSAPSVKVRHAQEADIDRLADIDLDLFDKAYGAKKPSKQEVVSMLTKRLQNGGEGMFVAELDGVVEGFVSTFRTDTPAEEFASWEQSTNKGTLDGKVSKDGKYGYVTNMTVRPAASKVGAKEMLLANLFAYGIESGVEYGYFESRMPLFRNWIERQRRNGRDVQDDEQSMSELAHEYMNLRRKDGSRHDPLLRLYEGYGFQLSNVVPDAFEDAASLNYGVICKAEVPPLNPTLKSIKPVRVAYAAALRLVAKSPKLVQKVL